MKSTGSSRNCLNWKPVRYSPATSFTDRSGRYSFVRNWLSINGSVCVTDLMSCSIKNGRIYDEYQRMFAEIKRNNQHDQLTFPHDGLVSKKYVLQKVQMNDLWRS